MLAELETKGACLNILYYEDEPFFYNLVKKVISKTFKKINIDHKKSFFMSDILLKTHLIDGFDLVIADINMRNGCNADEKFKDLERTGKPVIFYSSLPKKEFESICNSRLGHIPCNFVYLEKHAINNLNKMVNLIKDLIENEKGYS